MIRALCAAALIAAGAAFSAPCAASDALEFSAIRRLAVQHNGRIKPLDTYAREQVRFMYGRERIEGQDPVATVLSIQFAADEWRDKPVLDVPHIPLLNALGYDKAKRRLSYDEYLEHRAAVRGLAVGQSGKRLAEAAVELEAGAAVFEALTDAGSSRAVVPPLASSDDETWTALGGVTAHGKAKIGSVHDADQALGTAYLEGDAVGFEAASRALAERLRALNPAAYPSERRLWLECLYNAVNPFRVAWLLYIATFLAGLVALWSKRRVLTVAMLVLLAASLGVHTAGLVVRTIIAGRAPLTNMYESLVLMSWGIAALGLVFELVYRRRYAVCVAAALGIVTMAIAQRLTFDIRPAIAVLRSVWLSYHVLTVMLGYSAFAVALGAGHLVLGRHAFGKAVSAVFGPLDDFLYRALQVGVLFLTAGIITGSVWANYSWGRYWGWDPKETWSLITLLGYLGVLHARSQRWLRGFGMGVASILCFLLVVMTYYGVNYILRGLHSYAGDDPRRLPAWLIGYVVFEILYTGAAALVVYLREPARDRA